MLYFLSDFLCSIMFSVLSTIEICFLTHRTIHVWRNLLMHNCFLILLQYIILIYLYNNVVGNNLTWTRLVYSPLCFPLLLLLQFIVRNSNETHLIWGMCNFSVSDNAKFMLFENCGEEGYKYTGNNAADLVFSFCLFYFSYHCTSVLYMSWKFSDYFYQIIIWDLMTWC